MTEDNKGCLPKFLTKFIGTKEKKKNHKTGHDLSVNFNSVYETQKSQIPAYIPPPPQIQNLVATSSSLQAQPMQEIPVPNTSPKSEPKPITFPYGVRDSFLTNAELEFYYLLQKEIIKHKLPIFSKVRLADIFFVQRPHENAGAFNRIAMKHVDYLVCNPKTLQPVCGIELDDSTHNQKKRQDRDEFVDQVFAVAQLPLIHVKLVRDFDVPELKTEIQGTIRKQLIRQNQTSSHS